MRMIRGGLLVLTVYALVLGIPALLAPSWFFTEFPLGRGWVAELPPYNEHLVGTPARCSPDSACCWGWRRQDPARSWSAPRSSPGRSRRSLTCCST
jgi:hypothetical protein